MDDGLFRKRIIRYVDAEGKRCTASTPGAQKIEKQSKKWYTRGIPGYPPDKDIPLATNKRVAAAIRADLISQGERGQAGLADKRQARRPLEEHLADFEASMRAKGITEKQVRLTVGRVRRTIEGCCFQFISDISASKVEQFLAEMQKGETLADMDPAKEWYTRDELARLLNVKPDTISYLVSQHNLTGSGNGKSRKYPRETVRVLWEKARRGHGIQTANYYLREMKTFCKWLVNNNRLAKNPLGHLQGQNASVDQRRARRTLSGKQLDSLFAAAGQSDEAFRGLTGADRRMLYLTACGTGFREGELASLLPEWFHLDKTPPNITLPARKGKNRKPIIQPLPMALVAELREYLQGKPKGEPIWPGTWAERGAKMLRIDLAAADIPYVIEGPDGPLYADFHSLRHSFVALMDEAGLSLKQAMQLARHSDPKLTMARYGHAQLEELGQAVNRLPGRSMPVAQDLSAWLASLERGKLEQLALAGLVHMTLSSTVFEALGFGPNIKDKEGRQICNGYPMVTQKKATD